MGSISANRNVTVQDIRTNLLDNMQDTDRLRGKQHTFRADELYSKSAKDSGGTGGVETNSRATKAEAAKNILQKAINNTIDKSGMSKEAIAYAKEALKNITKNETVSGTKENQFLTKATANKILDHVETVLQNAEDNAKEAKLANNRDKYQNQLKNEIATLDLAQTFDGTRNVGSRPQLMVGMGQGFVGQLNSVQVFSDSFSTCSPLIIYNKDTGIGGLFHIPCPTVGECRDTESMERGKFLPYEQVDVELSEETREDIRQMLAMVNPTEVRLYSGSGTGHADGSNGQLSTLKMTELYVQGLVKELMVDAGVNDDKLTFTGTQLASLTVTANSQGDDLAVHEKSDMEGNGGHTNLVKERGVLPDQFEVYGVMRSHRNYDSTGDLMGGSKFFNE